MGRWQAQRAACLPGKEGAAVCIGAVPARSGIGTMGGQHVGVLAAGVLGFGHQGIHQLAAIGCAHEIGERGHNRHGRGSITGPSQPDQP